MATQIQIPKPQPGESLERYTVRVGLEYMGQVDPDQLNQAIWETYRQYRGNTDAEQVAAEKFPADRYKYEPAVCIFGEHQTTDSKGQKKNYTVRELYKIARNNNGRIEDVGQFTAIADGHTVSPTKENPRPEQPDVLAWAGNYRLGVIGRKQPRWGLFQDEYRPHATAEVLDRKPQRSVEVWHFPNGQIYINPVAALSSEAPRLPLPTRFQMLDVDGIQVERYSCDASAVVERYQGGAVAGGGGEGGSWTQPGSCSTHVPSFGRPKKTQYAEGPTHTGATPMLDQSMIQEFLQLLMETPAGKALDRIAKIPNFEQAIQKLAGPMPGDDIGDVEEDDHEPEAPEPPGAPPTAPPDEPTEIDDLIGGHEPSPEGTHPEPDGDEIDGKEPHGATKPKKEQFAMAQNEQITPERYSQLVAANADLRKSQTALIGDIERANQRADAATARVEALEHRAADAERYMMLTELAGRFPPGVVDVEDEAKAILYRNGAKLDDDGVKAHLGRVEKYAQRAAPAHVYIPEGAAPQMEQPSKYSLEQESQIVKAATSIITRHNETHPDNQMTWVEGKKQAIERLGLK